MKHQPIYRTVYSKEFDDTPLPKRFIKESLEQLTVPLNTSYCITKLDFTSCYGEYREDIYTLVIGSEDEMVDFLFNMSLTHSISRIHKYPGTINGIAISFIETQFGSNIDADVIQLFVDKFTSKNTP